MGMFDYVHSSYNLGEHFTDTICQTKGFDNTMSHYWIDPHGYLYLIDYRHTHDFIQLTPDNPEYDSKHLFFNFKWIPNGNKGKVSPYMITDYVEVYPEQWNGSYDDWPRCRIHFKYGRVMDFEVYVREG